MDIFDELDGEDQLFLIKNRRTRRTSPKGKTSIYNIDLYSKKVKIDSPRSLMAMTKLGINNEELEYLTFKEYLHKNPELIGVNKEIQTIKYNYVEELRKHKINQIKELRSEMTIEDIVPGNNRCYSSKIRGYNQYVKSSGKNKKKKYYSFLDKDIRSFNRVRSTHRADLFNRMNMELKKELVKIMNDEKAKKESEKNKKNQKLLNEMMKLENKKKLKEEEEKIQKEKEQEKLERKKEEKRIEQLIEKSINDEKLIKKRIKEERKRRDEEERLQSEFKKRMDMEREKNHLLLLKRENEQEYRIHLRQQEIEKEKKELRKSKEKIFREKRNKVANNLKRLEQEFEMRRLKYEENEKNKNAKKLRDEERYNREKKNIIREIEKEKEEKKKILKERNEQLTQKKMYDYNERQEHNKKKQQKMIYILKSKNSERQFAMEEKKQRQEENYFKNELLLSQKKEDIMLKISKRERSAQKAREKLKKKNLLAQEEQIQKVMKKDFRYKLIGQFLENKRNELKEQMSQKEKRIEEFLEYKNNMAQKKLNAYSEIDKEKQLNNEQLEKMLSKKNIDKNALNYIKEMFPDNQQIDNIIHQFNIYLDNKDKNKSHNYDN